MHIHLTKSFTILPRMRTTFALVDVYHEFESVTLFLDTPSFGESVLFKEHRARSLLGLATYSSLIHQALCPPKFQLNSSPAKFQYQGIAYTYFICYFHYLRI